MDNLEFMASGNNGVTTAGRDAHGRFTTGNPGRPLGARHKATLAAEALLQGEAEGLTRAAVEAALGGDVGALRLCLDRILPVRKGRPIAVELGPVNTIADLAAASVRLVESVSGGEVSPEEAQAIAGVIEAARRVIETQDLARRIEALELGNGLQA
ncbi:hypothetical protein M1105_19200 [Limibaculum sp. FT325]|uniref:hypothetical protein n=1 Tax=Thermohalobaculum sediminis TaxID=2939436 RepID=UPI0020BE0F85|nr:hypothetical protein [Limibaculum sediminis]MCL5779095.1 hypothetical protein [Limibaculum sediminis]